MNLESLGAAALTGLLAWGVPFITTRGQTRIAQTNAAIESKKAELNAELERARAMQLDEDGFRKLILEDLRAVRAENKELARQQAEQALTIAKLTGKVEVLEASEHRLKQENERLLKDNEQQRQQIDALEFENQAQAQKIAELNGTITELRQQHTALAPTPTTGDCP